MLLFLCTSPIVPNGGNFRGSKWDHQSKSSFVSREMSLVVDRDILVGSINKSQFVKKDGGLQRKLA